MRRAAVLIISSLLVVPSASAHHLDNPPLVHRQTTAGNAWFAVHLRWTDGADFIARLNIEQHQAEMFGAGVFGDSFAAAGVAWGRGTHAEVYAEPAGTIAALGRPEISQVDPFDVSSEGFDLYAGETTIVLMTVADGTTAGALEIFASSEVTVVGVTTGPAMFFHDGQLGGAAQARTQAGVVDEPLLGCCPRAQVTAAASVEIQSEYALFGWYSLGEGLASYRGPTETRSSQELLWNEPAGKHTFDITATASDGPTWIMAADVPGVPRPV